jgi:hypothetical protein
MGLIKRFWAAWVEPKGSIREGVAWSLLTLVEIVHWLGRWH